MNMYGLKTAGKKSRQAALLATLGLLLAGLHSMVAQSGTWQSLSPGPTGQTPTRPGRVSPPDMNEVFPNPLGDPRFQQRWMKLYNDRRHMQIVADTERLVRLTEELKAEIGGMHPVRLTESELRKVVEIQKLAHQVKLNMAMAPQSSPVFPDLPVLPLPGLRTN